MKSLYNGYFQKSKVFLYPLLIIPKGTSVTPLGSYTAWGGYYTHEDCKLMLVYHLRDDVEFKSFEKSRLFGNPHFYEFFETDDKKGVYVFDYSEYQDDWINFLQGKYSHFTKKTKMIIQSYYAKSKKNYVYVDSYLNPDLYYEMYSVLLNCNKKILEEVVELCDRPDFDKETLVANVKTIDLGKIHLTS
jgi:hypothetical protein